jgi:hypothetical protein
MCIVERCNLEDDFFVPCNNCDWCDEWFTRINEEQRNHIKTTKKSEWLSFEKS